MDLEESVQQNDGDTVNISIPLVTKIIYVIWLLMCLIPNSILIQKLSAYEYHQKNFYYIIVHWSWANILQMIYSIYVTFVPEELASDDLTAFSVFFYMLTPHPAQAAFFFTIDKYVNSKTFCRDNTRMGYKSLGFALILLSILGRHDVAHTFSLAIGLVAVESTIMLAFMIRLIVYCCKGSEEENSRLRIIMASICIVTNYLIVVYVVLDVFLGYNIQEVYFYVTMVIHLNGMVNIALLHFYDPSINIPRMISEKLDSLKRKFRTKASVPPASEQEASRPMSRFEHSV